jgi:hypothetical protein
MEERKRRIKPFSASAWSYKDWLQPRVVGDLDLSGWQRTLSEGHPYSRLGKGTEDIGGDFRTDRIVFDPNPNRRVELWRSEEINYQGPMFSSMALKELWEKGPGTRWEDDSPAASPGFLDSSGTTLISRAIPTNPVASAAATIGELREGLPSLPTKSMIKKPGSSSAGSEHLNIEFGIKPMIADVKKLAEAHKKSEKILAQLERDSGKIVRRRRSLPPSEEQEKSRTWTPNPGAPVLLTSYLAGGGYLTRTITTKRRLWFSGAFQYHLPEVGTWRRKLSEYEAMYGIIPTPETLWQLAPWSWAIDWFANVGDIVHNLSNFGHDGLVLRYGYVMCHTVRHVEEAWEGELRVNDTMVPIVLRNSYTWETKQRRRATPFGFGLKETDLSDRQLAIIAALGLSRNRT